MLHSVWTAPLVLLFYCHPIYTWCKNIVRYRYSVVNHGTHHNSLLFSCSVFKPIFASAKMCINPNAEVELKSPKANLHLEVQNIAIEMTKPQV